MSFWQRILNFFKSNKAILQLTIQALAGEFFKKNPRYKAMVGSMASDVLNSIHLEPQSVVDVRRNLQNRINILGSNPAEKALLSTVLDALFVEVEKYITKEGIIGVAKQTQVIAEVLDWIVQASKY